MNALALTIANTPIRQDLDGRYCLNDLHESSGGHQKHRPKYWLQNQQTKDLVAEIEIGGISPIQAKQGFGTYVVKELVYSYAMWISPAFSLQVIRAYDALVTGNTSTRDYEALQHKYITLLEQDNARLKSTFSAPGVAFGQHRGWTAAQDAELLALKAEGLGYTAIGVRVGRSRENCRYRYNNLIAKQGGAA